METTNNDKPTNTNYALNGKIMLCSVIILFIVVFAVACFHSYLNGCFHRHPRRRRRNRARHLLSRRVSLANAIIETVSVSPTPKALGPSILKTLPTFVYSPTAHSPVVVLECAVCLSDFEDEDQGRVLPNCNHTFHEDCIDTWFQSHSNCPLCRAPVQPDMPEIPSEIAIIMSEPPGSEHQRAETEMGCSRCSPSTSFSPEEGGRRLLELEGISVDDARDDERLKRGLGSPKNDGLKSSGNQILSLKRIWSI